MADKATKMSAAMTSAIKPWAMHLLSNWSNPASSRCSSVASSGTSWVSSPSYTLVHWSVQFYEFWQTYSVIYPPPQTRSIFITLTCSLKSPYIQFLPVHRPWQAIICFVSVVLLFSECHINEILQYVNNNHLNSGSLCFSLEGHGLAHRLR